MTRHKPAPGQGAAMLARHNILMSAAPPPRASANAPRPISARCPGLRRFGNPATLPLRWMPDRMRADVLAIWELIKHRPAAGLGYGAALAAAVWMTLFFVSGPDRHPTSEQLAALTDTVPHAENTFQ